MPSKVFLSWSGRLSENVALLLKKWLPSVIQGVEPFFSRTDIRKGFQSMEALTENLHDAKVGISCLTYSNRQKPWIEFEAGFLAGRKIPVCGLLINLSVDDVKLPLSNFQHTLPHREDMFNLLKSIRDSCNIELTDISLHESLDNRWSTFEENLNKLLRDPAIVAEEQRKTEVITENTVREIVGELLENQQKIKVLNREEYDELEKNNAIDDSTVYMIV